MKKTILSSFMIITVFNALDRTLGFFFRIYLSREMGAEIMGLYQVATSVFMALLTFITSGIPLVVSKSTAKAIRSGREDKCCAIASAALYIGLTTALIAFVGAISLGDLIRATMGQKAAFSLTLLTPSLLFSAVYSAFRGSLWGKKKFFAVALVEVVEQVARIASCVVMFYCGIDKLTAASLALTVGCAVSAITCACFYFASNGRVCSPKGEFKPLLKSEIPITLSRAVSTLASSLLSVAAPLLFMLSGYSSERAYEIFGAASGMALPLLFVPLTVIGSLAFVLIPHIGANADEGKFESINRSICSSINFSTMIACLFIPLFFVCGENIGIIVYDNVESGIFLSVSAWILLPLSLEAITSSLMNSLDLEMKSFINSMIGYVCQALIYAALARSFTMEVFALGIGVSLVVATALHLRCICKKTSLRLWRLRSVLPSVLLLFPAVTLNRSLLGIFSFLPPLFDVIISGGATMLSYLILSLTFDSYEVYGSIAKISKPLAAK